MPGDEAVLARAETAEDPGAPHRTGTRRGARRDPLVPGLVVAAVVAGVLLRVWVLRSPLGVVDSDEAIAGLIAMDFLDGRFTVFLWKNAYGGTMEAILAAPLFALVGPSALVIKAVSAACYAGAALLSWRIALRVGAGRAAALAGLVAWVYPAAYVLASTKGRMYYGSGAALATAAVLLVLRVDARARAGDVALLGLVLGLALWATPFAILVPLPAVIWLVVRRPGVLRWAPVAIPAALLGAAPWLGYNLRNSWLSFEQPGDATSTYLGRLGGFFTRLLPGALGLRGAHSGDWLLGPLGVVAYVAVVVGAVWLLVRHRRSLGPVAAAVAAYPLLFAVPNATAYVAEPRYGLFVAPLLAVVAAFALRGVAAARLVPPAVVLLATLVTVGSLLHLLSWTDRTERRDDVDPPPVGRLIDELEARGVGHLYADYWIAYRLTLETDEEIIATPVEYIREIAYDQAAAAAGARTYVLYDGDPEERRFATALTERGIGAHREVVDGYAVYELDRHIPPSEFPGAWFG